MITRFLSDLLTRVLGLRQLAADLADAEHAAAHAELVQPDDAPQPLRSMGEVKYDTIEIRPKQVAAPAEYKLVQIPPGGIIIGRRVRIADDCDLVGYRACTGRVLDVMATWDGVNYAHVQLDAPMEDWRIGVFLSHITPIDGDDAEEHY